jgi:hypothetical protein
MKQYIGHSHRAFWDLRNKSWWREPNGALKGPSKEPTFFLFYFLIDWEIRKRSQMIHATLTSIASIFEQVELQTGSNPEFHHLIHWPQAAQSRLPLWRIMSFLWVAPKKRTRASLYMPQIYFQTYQPGKSVHLPGGGVWQGA